MTELDAILQVRGFTVRQSQTRLFEHLASDDQQVIAQAGTGTGKSIAVLAAAARAARKSGEQSIVITPTLTLMNQYANDVRWAENAFDDLSFAEIRGMRHYECAQSARISEQFNLPYEGGCLGMDGGCSQKGWEGHGEFCDSECPILHQAAGAWVCGYREARYEAKRSSVVVTNTDMLIVNDRILYGLGANFLSLEGSLFVDEAHALESKLRDYASRSLHWSSLKRFRFAGDSGRELADWLERQADRGGLLSEAKGFPMDALVAIATSTVPESTPGNSMKRQQETQEACDRIWAFTREPHDHAVLHVNSGSLRFDWINIARSAGELLRQRPFGLVSATIPRTMAAGLGVPDASFIDVGHPFDYANQCWIGFSPYAGDYRSAQVDSNFTFRVNEVRDLIDRAGGGALLLFSSFRDLEEVHGTLAPHLRAKGLRVLVQERDMEAVDRQALADDFRADGNAVMFGSESFATGFDVPGDALRLVVLWKLPYPAVDPVSNAIRANSYARYDDMMRVRAVQAMGRLIRTDTDRGIVWVADSRGRRLVDPSDPLTAHITQFARL